MIFRFRAKLFMYLYRLSDMENPRAIGFGGGCHWCTEAVFQSVRGVGRVQQGWICPAGNSDFSEAVLVHFDPGLIDLSLLVAIHLHSHSSTSDHSMRQKYRSAVYVFDEVQRQEVMGAMTGLKGEFDADLVTKVLDFGSFRSNTADFLDYYATDPSRPFCTRFIDPKLMMLLDRFGSGIISPVAGQNDLIVKVCPDGIGKRK